MTHEQITTSAKMMERDLATIFNAAKDDLMEKLGQAEMEGWDADRLQRELDEVIG